MNKKIITIVLSIILLISGMYFIYVAYNLYNQNNRKDNKDDKILSQKIELKDKVKVLGSEELEASGLNIIATENGSNVDTTLTNVSENAKETKCVKIIVKDEAGNVLMEAFVDGIGEIEKNDISSIHLSSSIDLSKAYSYEVVEVE